MQNDMRDRLVELLKKADENACAKAITDYEDAILDNAEYLIANGVIIFDMNVIQPKNRPLITHIATMPLDDVLELIQQKLKEMRVENG